MRKITEYTIILKQYHGEIVGRLAYWNIDCQRYEESLLFSVNELNNIIALWQSGNVLGSFGIGTILATDAVMVLEEK